MFSLFKRKPKEEKHTQMTSVICIPGIWNDMSEIFTSIEKNNPDEYLCSLNILVKKNSKKIFILEICEKDNRMSTAFEYAGKVNNLSNEFITEIEKHNFVIYLSIETGTFESAYQIAHAASAILKSGGIGVKVETAGKAFTKEDWLNLTADISEGNLYKQFVLDSIIQDDGTVHSCGMHNLGFKDTIVSNEEFQNSVDLIKIFNFYQLIDLPQINNNQTFQASIESPIYKITDEINQPYKGDDLFENPFGVWRLSKQ